MYIKYIKWTVMKHGSPLGIAVVKFNPFNLKTKTLVTMNDGREFNLEHDYMSDDVLQATIEKFIHSKA